MNNLESVKNRLIDSIMLNNDEIFLTAIEQIFNATTTHNTVKLNSYEIELLKMSEIDIQKGNIISEEELQKLDAEWMN